jgi:hypothetical protein
MDKARAATVAKRIVMSAVLALLLAVAAPAGERPPRGAVSPASAYAAFLLGEMVSAAGAPVAPEIFRGPVDSARAVIIDGREAILYNPVFLEEVTERAGTEWAAASVIAHELGHHYYGHAHDAAHGLPPGVVRERELEADYFSGYVLARMGAAARDAEAAQEILFDEAPSETHPGSQDRMRAILAGWADGRDGERLTGSPLERVGAARNRLPLLP